MKCPQKECHLQRLSKFLAYAGIASRRNSEKLIITGRVSVNGVIVVNPATKVSNSDAIFFDGCLIKNELINPRMWIYHKPVGELCSDHDPYGKRKVFDSFPKNIGKVCLVGRLDYNSRFDDEGVIEKIVADSIADIWYYRSRTVAFIEYGLSHSFSIFTVVPYEESYETIEFRPDYYWLD